MSTLRTLKAFVDKGVPEFIGLCCGGTKQVGGHWYTTHNDWVSISYPKRARPRQPTLSKLKSTDCCGNNQKDKIHYCTSCGLPVGELGRLFRNCAKAVWHLEKNETSSNIEPFSSRRIHFRLQSDTFECISLNAPSIIPQSFVTHNDIFMVFYSQCRWCLFFVIGWLHSEISIKRW